MVLLVKSFTSFCVYEFVAVIYIGIINLLFVCRFKFFLTEEADENSNVSTIQFAINFYSQIGSFPLFWSGRDGKSLNEKIFLFFSVLLLGNGRDRKYRIESATLSSFEVIFQRVIRINAKKYSSVSGKKNSGIILYDRFGGRCNNLE